VAAAQQSAGRPLYKKYPSFSHDLNYSAQVKRTGVELLVLDPRLRIPGSLAGEEKKAA
jgi:DNA adenine methylase